MFKPNFERDVHEGIQKVYFFPNGYGASVIRHSFSYGGDQGLWELAVLKGTLEKYELCYTTEITDDVLGYLDNKEVEETLSKIQNLVDNQPKSC